MTAKISAEYREAAIQGMSLNITENEMFILIPSERGNGLYRVDMDEATMSPKSCNCAGHSRWGHCKHCTVIAECFAGYVAPVVVTPVEPRITEVEAGTWYVLNRNTQVFKTDDGVWMAIGPTENAIAIVEAHLASQKQDEMPTQQPVVASPVVVVEPVAEPAYTMSPDVYAKLASLSKASAEPAVEVVEEVAEPVKDNVVDIGLRGSLNGNRGFQLIA